MNSEENTSHINEHHSSILTAHHEETKKVCAHENENKELSSSSSPSATFIEPEYKEVMDAYLEKQQNEQKEEEEEGDRQREQREAHENDDNNQEFQREVKIAKVSFVAYKNAVTHLTCQQDEEQRDEETFGVREVYKSSFSESILMEQSARQMIDTKARTFFEAIHIANHFAERRKEREVGRSALFQELLTVGQNSSSIVHPKRERKNHMGSCLSSIKQSSPAQSKEVTASTPIKQRKQQKMVPNSINKSSNKKKDSNKKEIRANPKAKTQRTTSIHTDPNCIRSTLPPFRFCPESPPQKAKTAKNKIPASYGTTTWIQNLVQWRAQKQLYFVESLRYCGCSDCSKELKNMD